MRIAPPELHSAYCVIEISLLFSKPYGSPNATYERADRRTQEPSWAQGAASFEVRELRRDARAAQNVRALRDVSWQVDC